MNYKVTRKQVTEKFVNTSGVAITPPTGFTQNKKTPMTSNAFTFKQAGTLPDTYTAGGKTYKFKGWYKGRTKPSTLTATKAPSYAVTYDGNDDLNVVYEEVNFPAVTYQFGFVSEAGQLVNPADINITYYYRRYTSSSFNSITTNQLASNSGNLKRIVMPATYIPQPTTVGVGNGDLLSNFSIAIPKYYQSLSLYDKTGKINPTYPLPKMTDTGGNTSVSEQVTINRLKLTKRANNSYVPFEANMNFDPSVKFPILFNRQITNTGAKGYLTLDNSVYYHLTNRRVTENFVDTSGAKITAPSGFTQGKQTVINSDPYTFKQAGTLPDTYTAGGKTYKFKGWYKGKTKPSTLTTTKAPSYLVTYDDNDDLNVVYEEVKTKTYTLPSKEITFGYVDEKGNLINPANFILKATMSETTKSGKTTLLPTITGTNVTTTNLKKLTIPQKVYTLPEPIDDTTYGTRNVTHEIPKYYRTISISPTATYTGDKTKYPIANEVRKEITNPSTIVTSKPGTNIYDLNKTNNTLYNTHLYFWEWDTTKAPYAMGVYSGIVGANYNLATPDKTVYYYLENRRVTENFVDTSGAKITAPTGFTQGKKTVISSDGYTFKQAGTLPDTYTTGGKTYKFKGWYKGKSKPSTLTTTKAPSYLVTYDDNDDLNVVYEETKEKTAMIPAVTYKFGFVDEKGALVAPANFNMTTNLTTIMNGMPKQVGTAGGVNNGNLKQLTIPSQQLTYTPTDNPAFSGATNFRLTVPKQYKLPAVTPGTYYTGSSTAYPVATRRMRYVDSTLADTRIEKDGKYYSLHATTKANEYRLYYTNWLEDKTATQFASILTSANTEVNVPNYYTTNDTMYYFLENRRVTENFVDTSGAKITAPTGFTQGKKTVITSDGYTFKQAGTLPDTYTTGGKTYKFKGWYKGKSRPNTLTTTKAPSYPVTYDDNDDLNVVYEEETVTTFYPSLDVNFVDEKGTGFTPALTFSGKYYVRRTSDNVITNLYDVTSKSNGNGQYTVSINNGSVPLSQELFKEYTNGYLPISTNSLTFRLDKLAIDQQLKYVDSIQVETAQSSGLNVYRYDYTNNSSTIIDSSVAPTVSNLPTADINGLNFKTDGTNFSNNSFRFLGMTIGGSMNANGIYLFYTNLFSNNPTNDSKLVYKVTRKQVTENFVDANGTKITAPTGFTQGNKIPMTSNTFKYTAAKALPATYTAGGKVYTFQGWYKGKTKPSTLNKTTTPTFNATFDGNDDMTAMYQEEVPKASVALTRTTAETVTSGGNVTWRATITNPSKAPLTTATIKKSTAWSTGLAAPTAMIVTPVGGTAKTVPVTATTWTNGVSLGIDIPAGQSATVQFTTKATGTAGQVLRASITTSGNYSGVSASATVRVKDNDQEIVTPTTEGFISVPIFDFGQVGVAGTKQQHSLKKAADYYGNGTRNPYLRIKKTQPNWRLTAQLSQPKSATDSLPTATRLLLGAAPVSSFANYNLPTELKNAVGTTSAISLTANNTATSIIANQQFTGSNVYQLDFTFNNVKLEVPANQGVKGQQYKAAVTWNLVTGP
ncbi:WxL domain-containing protein [Enterococcus faecalis]